MVALCFIKSSSYFTISRINLYGSSFIYIFSLLLLYNSTSFDILFSDFKIFYYSDFFDWPLIIGLDALALLFICLTNLLIFSCFLYNHNNIFIGMRENSIFLFMMQFFLNLFFVSTNIFWFFMFFECVLVPMFFLIGLWGSRIRKIHATYYFYLYTLFGSFFMFFAMLLIYSYAGTGEFDVLKTIKFEQPLSIVIFVLLFFCFAIKVPMLPFHIWLPEAHVEAPTVGSVLLAGVLLKLGVYGIFRILIPVFPEELVMISPFVYLVATISIIYCSFAIMRQIDLKKIIAYSSVIHMNFALVGLFSLTLSGVLGGFYLMINHGIVSSALFFCVGSLYDRYHTRLVTYYGGLNLLMPVFSLFFIIFTLANFGFPGTSSFIGEFLVIFGAFDVSSLLAYITNISMLSSTCYMLWLMNRVLFGPVKLNKTFMAFDLTYKEIFMFLPFIFFVFFFGFYPNIFIEKYEFFIYNLI
jgi:proton-translocating NADH-quinone oxidoreductase chain M